jgi:hypothetical protein
LITRKHHPTGAWGQAISALALLLLVGGTPARAELAPQPEYLLKAKILVAFSALYAEFDQHPLGPGENLVICVVGTYPFRDYFQRKDVRMGNRAILVRRLSHDDPLDGCRVLYLTAEEARFARDIIERARHRPILTVGETPDFLDAGGVVAFESADNRIHFSVNLDACETQGIHFKANVLKLARRILRTTTGSEETSGE